MSLNRWRLHDRKNKQLIEHLCSIRGFDSKYLAPDYEEHLHDPNLLPDMDKARSLVRKAKEDSWSVVIFGDYDADGSTASAVLSILMERLGIKHRVILPTRQSGYGLNKEVIESFAGEVNLLITVDTGITAVEEIKLAKKLGIKVIVIDHHLPKKTLPPADAVVDPFVPASQYPFPYLCGCALAYKLVVALSDDFPNELTPAFSKWLLDLVAVATVADMMPLKGENRVLVYYGLKVLSKSRRVGISELLRQSGVDPAAVNTYMLGYIIGPRLNASGRIDDNRPALDLLLSKDKEAANKLAFQIEKANNQRQKMVKQVQFEAENLIWKQNSKNDHCLIVVQDDWPTGILGLVAGRLSSKLYRPVIALSKNVDSISGSARSVEDYSIISGLEASADYLDRFGGHKSAAGLALSPHKLEEFIASIKAHANNNIKPENLRPVITIDAQLSPEELKTETVERIESLSPFGHANPMPLLFLPDINLGSCRKIGSQGSHLKATAVINDREVDVIGFGLAEQYFDNPLERIDLVGSLEFNRWNGNTGIQIKIKDYRPGGVGVDEIVGS